VPKRVYCYGGVEEYKGGDSEEGKNGGAAAALPRMFTPVKASGGPVATAIDSNSLKAHRRQDQLATVYIKPYTSFFLQHSFRVVHHLLRQRLSLPPTPFSPACFLPLGYLFIRPRGNQMGTKFWEVVRNEHGTGGSGEYYGDHVAHHGRINALYREASGGKYLPRAVLFDLEPGVTGAVTLFRRSANSIAREACGQHAREGLV
jgi:hypothetical protein